MKSPRQVIPILVALTLAAMLSGCSKNSTPTGLSSLDQSPPAAPTHISAEMDASTANAMLQWTPSPSANVAGYQVYQYSPSPDRENAYVLAGETDAATTRFGLPWAYERTAMYYRLRAVSSTGVKSEWSTVAKATIGPPQADPATTPSSPDENPSVPVRH